VQASTSVQTSPFFFKGRFFTLSAYNIDAKNICLVHTPHSLLRKHHNVTMRDTSHCNTKLLYSFLKIYCLRNNKFCRPLFWGCKMIKLHSFLSCGYLWWIEYTNENIRNSMQVNSDLSGIQTRRFETITAKALKKADTFYL